MVLCYGEGMRTAFQEVFRRVVLGVGVSLFYSLTACSYPTLMTLTIFETPSRSVHLTVDPTIYLDSDFSHPVAIPADTMKALLGGLVIIEPVSFFSWPFKENKSPRHPLFSDADIRFWAPLLAKALDSATPEEMVTFYQSDDISAVSREVTSGGLFVKDQLLYFILTNYRAPSQFMADYGTADTLDDRRNPLRSMAPQQVTLQFEPDRLVVAPQENSQSVGLSLQRRAIAVLFRQLPILPSGLAREQDTTTVLSSPNPQRQSY